MLKELAEEATALKINLNGEITKDQTGRPRGSSGVVYGGTRGSPGTRVAVKVLHPGLSSNANEATIKQILEEFQRWSRLQHQNVLPLLGITTDYEQTVSLVTNWVDKGNSHDYVQDQTVDPRPLLVGIARGLQYLHNQPTIHGDVKGFNVLISDQGHPLLTDYGLSSLVNVSFSQTVSYSNSNTLRWMAPETMKSENQEMTVKGDVWAFGMIALELFTRQVPFPDKQGLHEVNKRVQEGPPDRPDNDSTISRMTDEWWSICLLCWQDQEHRPDMSGVISEIEQIGQRPPEKKDATVDNGKTQELQPAPGDAAKHPQSGCFSPILTRLARIFRSR